MGEFNKQQGESGEDKSAFQQLGEKGEGERSQQGETEGKGQQEELTGAAGGQQSAESGQQGLQPGAEQGIQSPGGQQGQQGQAQQQQGQQQQGQQQQQPQEEQGRRQQGDDDLEGGR